MPVIADLHIHSRFSRATSKKLTSPYLDRWARIKGIDLLGTGDCTHPLWLKELRDQLEDAEPGLYHLKPNLRRDFDKHTALEEGLPKPSKDMTRFVLTGEISTIYKRAGATRKVHHLIILPDFKAAAALQTRLERVGTINADGRPIFGIDSQDLLTILLDVDDRSLLIPAHIWTPWFSVLGAKSGFDSLEECFGDGAKWIPAIETGLSSNPPMNWALPSLDPYAIISNSDAHSPEKLGREATVFSMDLNYQSLWDAIWSVRRGTGAKSGILETIEFFPQEGKYHYAGHRKCGICLSPGETAPSGGVCPVCGKPLTQGVMERVLELAQSPVDESAPCPEGYGGTNRRPYQSLIPLRELLAELLETGAASKKVDAVYGKLIEDGGSEFAILSDLPLEDIRALGGLGIAGDLLAEAIDRMRSGTVSVTPGYDGEYGVIRVYAPGFKPEVQKTVGKLFDDPEPASSISPASGKFGGSPSQAGSLPLQKELFGEPAIQNIPDELVGQAAGGFQPDADQEAAVSYEGKQSLIIAGPGTGKTAVLTARIFRLLEEGRDPSSILALTFTVKAATELRERISRSGITAATFHSLCCSLLREYPAIVPEGFQIIGDAERSAILGELCAQEKGASPQKLGNYIEEKKRFLLLPWETEPRLGPLGESLWKELRASTVESASFHPGPADAALEELYHRYRQRLRTANQVDYDDLPLGTIRLLWGKPDVLAQVRRRYRHILVDEYQDINFAQYILIRLLAPKDAEIENSAEPAPELRVIGDPNQAIYAFRGSDKRFLERFFQDYPDAARFHLSRSFRCAAPLIEAANRLTNAGLQGNSGTVSLYRASYPTEKSEAEGIARRIAALIGGTSFFALDSAVASGHGETGPADCAILLRTALLAPPLIKALEDHHIPFEFSGDKPWWEREPVQGLLAVLRDRALQNRADGRHSPSGNPQEAVQAAINAMAPKRKGKGKDKGSDTSPDLERLINLAALYDDLGELLDTLAVSGAEDDPLGTLKPQGVRIMTIHASKGLEFDQVFVPALEEGILPFTLFEGDQDPEKIEEEQRLCYVAMTRAKRGLFLSWARSRNLGGRKLNGGASRFLAKLEDLIPLEEGLAPRQRDPQLRLF